jgi:hypothetical protein
MYEETDSEGICDGCANHGPVGMNCELCGGSFQDLETGLDEEDLDDDDTATYPLEDLDKDSNSNKEDEEE